MIGALPPPRAPVPSAIVRRAIDGDSCAEEELIHHFARGLLSHLTRRLRDREAARELADDVLMAMVRALREHRLHDPERLAGFVYGTARNLINNHLRTRQGLPHLEPLDPTLATQDAGERLEQSERLDRVRECLDGLGALERQIVLMTIEGLKPGRIAADLGLSRDVVRARKSRAMRKLATSLELEPPARSAARLSARAARIEAAGRIDRRRRPWRIR
jgi:RNA polymerase sigma-70 factor, ECF subfamily